ncbi:MAG: RNB domain-containing ribonuclease [Bdellovibrionales bacterium]|nr:RNB domain-containing ribonuclease [Bdellovibrionales bacterium]
MHLPPPEPSPKSERFSDLSVPTSCSLLERICGPAGSPELCEAAKHIQSQIPTWLPQHEIDFRDGGFVVRITNPIRFKNVHFDLLENQLKEAATPYPLTLEFSQPREPYDNRRDGFGGTSFSRSRDFDFHSFYEMVERTAPDGVAPIKVAFSPAHESYGVTVAIIRVQTSSEASGSLREWKEKLQDKFDCVVTFQVDSCREDLKSQLRPLADRDGILRNFSLLPEMEEFVHGVKRPLLRPEYREPLSELDVPDFTAVEAIAIDNLKTKNPEDIIAVEPLPNGNFLAMTGTSLYRRVKPGNDLAEYAKHAGEDIYANGVSLSVFPREHVEGEAALLEGKDRYVILSSAEVSPRGEILKYDLSIVRMKNHCQLNYDQANEILSGRRGHRYSEKLEELSHFASVLKSGELKNRFFVGRGTLTPAEEVVAQFSILSQHILGKVFEDYNAEAKTPIPLLYRVHTGPTREIVQRLVDEISNAGVPCDLGIFSDRDAMSQTLDRLSQIGREDLLEELLSVLYQRGYYSDVNDGHSALKLGAYARLKIRGPGWINQIQVRSLLLGEKGFTSEQLEELEDYCNENQRRTDYKFHKLRFYLDLKEQEPKLGREFTARVKRARKFDNELYVSVPGFHRWGVVKLEGTSKHARDFRRGQTIRVRFDGLDVDSERMNFSKA